MSYRKRSKFVIVCSDIHFDLHNKEAWAAFRKFHRDTRPYRTVIAGDFLDFGMLSRYVQEPDAPVHAIPQIQVFVREVNALAKESGEVVVLEGNHDERWSKIIGVNPQTLKGAKGLSLEDQCLAQGMDPRVVWVREDLMVRGVPVGPVNIRHGHKQSGKFGPKHLASNRLDKTMGQWELIGHHHRAEVMYRSAYGRTAAAIVNPGLTGPHHYAADPNWQTGFTVLEVFGQNDEHCTPHLIVMQENAFAWNGEVYDGKYILSEQERKR